MEGLEVEMEAIEQKLKRKKGDRPKHRRSRRTREKVIERRDRKLHSMGRSDI